MKKHHPYSEIWPLMSGKDFEKLKADIKVNGLRMPVITYKDMVLDGRNRERACRDVGEPVRYEVADAKSDEDALSLVVSLNESRRHMTVAQRAFAAAKLANILNGHNKYKSRVGVPAGTPSSNSTTMSVNQASDKLGVSRGSAHRARVILQKGTKQDEEDVVAGKVSLEKRAKELRPVENPRAPSKRPPTAPRIVYSIPHTAGPSKHLTQEEIDPEFKGTPMEWTDKYGHVQVMTAEKYSTERYDAWSSNVRALVRRWKELPDLGRELDLNWLRSPNQHGHDKMVEALAIIEPLIAKARAMCDVAQAALEKKANRKPQRGANGSSPNS